MAGILGEYFSLPPALQGLYGKVQEIDRATAPFMGDFWKQIAPGFNVEQTRRPDPAHSNILDAILNPTPGGLSQGQFDERFGGMQPPAAQAQAPTAGAAYSPQVAGQIMNAPTYSYPFGGQMVETFGQPPEQLQVSAQRRNQQPTPVSAQSVQDAPQQPAQQTNPMMEALSAIRPGFVARYEARKTQQQNAQNLSTFFQGQGMNPQQANAMASVAAANPKIMEEFFKQPATVEGALARDMAFGTGGGGRGNAQTRALDWLRNKSSAEKEGQKSGEVSVEKEELRQTLPTFVEEAKNHIRMVEELRNHPGRKGNIWWHNKMGSWLPDASVPNNTDAGDAISRLGEIKGGAFLEAFKSLKGGGQITEIEGKKATEAKNRMSRATSEEEFNRAADDYVAAIKRGVEQLQREARVTPDSSSLAPSGGWKMYPGNIRARRIGD